MTDTRIVHVSTADISAQGKAAAMKWALQLHLQDAAPRGRKAGAVAVAVVDASSLRLLVEEIPV
jgi:hypothetical protein